MNKIKISKRLKIDSLGVCVKRGKTGRKLLRSFYWKRRGYRRDRKSAIYFLQAYDYIFEKRGITKSVAYSRYGRLLRSKRRFRLLYPMLREKNIKKLLNHISWKLGSGESNDFLILENFFNFLERRLDMAVLRLNFVANVIEVRQLINHRRIQVNSLIVSKPGFLLTEGDFVQLTNKWRLVYLQILMRRSLLSDSGLRRNKVRKFLRERLLYKESNRVTERSLRVGFNHVVPIKFFYDSINNRWVVVNKEASTFSKGLRLGLKLKKKISFRHLLKYWLKSLGELRMSSCSIIAAGSELIQGLKSKFESGRDYFRKEWRGHLKSRFNKIYWADRQYRRRRWHKGPWRYLGKKRRPWWKWGRKVVSGPYSNNKPYGWARNRAKQSRGRNRDLVHFNKNWDLAFVKNASDYAIADHPRYGITKFWKKHKPMPNRSKKNLMTRHYNFKRRFHYQRQDVKKIPIYVLLKQIKSEDQKIALLYTRCDRYIANFDWNRISWKYRKVIEKYRIEKKNSGPHWTRDKKYEVAVEAEVRRVLPNSKRTVERNSIAAATGEPIKYIGFEAIVAVDFGLRYWRTKVGWFRRFKAYWKKNYSRRRLMKLMYFGNYDYFKGRDTVVCNWTNSNKDLALLVSLDSTKVNNLFYSQLKTNFFLFNYLKNLLVLKKKNKIVYNKDRPWFSRKTGWFVKKKRKVVGIYHYLKFKNSGKINILFFNTEEKFSRFKIGQFNMYLGWRHWNFEPRIKKRRFKFIKKPIYSYFGRLSQSQVMTKGLKAKNSVVSKFEKFKYVAEVITKKHSKPLFKNYFSNFLSLNYLIRLWYKTFQKKLAEFEKTNLKAHAIWKRFDAILWYKVIYGLWRKLDFLLRDYQKRHFTIFRHRKPRKGGILGRFEKKMKNRYKKRIVEVRNIRSRLSSYPLLFSAAKSVELNYKVFGGIFLGMFNLKHIPFRSRVNLVDILNFYRYRKFL